MLGLIRGAIYYLVIDSDLGLFRKVQQQHLI